MEFFERLGATIENRWKEADYREDAFARIAEAGLQELQPSEHVTFLDVVEWVHSEEATQALARTDGFNTGFGEPNITVFRTPRFIIEVLAWVDGTTAIHQHSFAGAFHVLEGGSIHSRYEFDAEERICENLHAGKLELREVELLKRGDVRRIDAGSALIHALFHLDRPSLTVVVRTDSFGLSLGAQFAYWRCGLAFNPFLMNEQMHLRVQTVALMLRTDHPRVGALLREKIERADALEAFLLVKEVITRVESPDRCIELLRGVSRRHEKLIERMLLAEQDLRRERSITNRRGSIRDRDHRFLLALLLNLRSRGPILSLVARAYPEVEPVDWILKCVKELCAARPADARTGAEASAMGLRLGDCELAVLGHLLHGATDEGVVARLREEYDDEDVEREAGMVGELCRAYRSSLLLGALLAPEDRVE
jgi:hypothetical protein